MNNFMRRCISVILAGIITWGSLWYVNQVLVLKRADGITTMKDFYAQEENTVDLLILGSSHSGMNLDAETFWSEYGISSYALWGSVQPFWNTYHFLVEALKTQSPKVVVLDVYAATNGEEYSDDARQVTNIAGMKLSRNKLEAIKVSAPKERWWNLLLGFPIYHQRYAELSKNDFLHFPWSEGQKENKGTGVRYGTKEYSVEDASLVTEVAQIYEKQEKYLRKIIELCSEEDIPLLLIKTPTVPRIYEQPYYNAVAQIAQEYAVPFYNFNQMDAELGFSGNYYWTDGAHLNTEGARLVSRYLAKILVENYGIQDHRGDENYHSWQTNAVVIQNQYIPKITNTEDYFEELRQTDRTVLIIKNSSWEISENYVNLVNGLVKIGADYETMLNGGGGDWLIPNAFKSDFINQYFGDLYSSFEHDGQLFSVDFKDGTGISINGKTLYNLEGPGVICVVYDSNTDMCVDIVTFLVKDEFGMKHIPVNKS